jgi:beta-lactamase class A
VVNKNASREMLAILERQQDHRGIGRTLKGVKLASKAGALNQLRSDVGIVYSQRGRIALAITCDEMPETVWNDENPGLLMLSRLGALLVEGLGK